MAESKKQFVCRACGVAHLQWAGQCLDCKAWNTLEEVLIKPRFIQDGFLADFAPANARNLSEVQQENQPRISTGLSELDKTLGGGLVVGSVVLVGGDPGVGKSTLILQCLANIHAQYPTFYISGEESESQIATRARRLKIKQDLLLVNETSLERIIELSSKLKPKVMVVDSIQTVVSPGTTSLAGSASQVRDCTTQLTQYAKKTQTTLLITGHTTKDGALAGPRILEHIVDTVLYFEGDIRGRYRIVRAVKNRFGAVNELSIFVMQQQGLLQVKNPSAIFLSNQQTLVPGVVITVMREASRPLLVELQALVSQNVGGSPSRVCMGIEQNRLLLLLAILQKHAGIVSYDQDIFINIVGGLKILETASDLSLLLAIISSITNKAIPRTWISFGEVGLTAEIRPVYNGLERLKEAKKHGFKLAIIPQGNMPSKTTKSFKIIAVSTLSEVLDFLHKNL